MEHPDGLPFSPEGEGWTLHSDQPVSDQRTRLLTENNIKTIRKHHPDAWNDNEAALTSVLPKNKIDTKTGRLTVSLNEDERNRLVALSLFIKHGVVREAVTSEAVPE